MHSNALRRLFAQECFRDPADRDYIAARVLYRSGLIEPFLWSSLQAVEKYLKGILLFRNLSTLHLGHDVAKALRRVQTTRWLPVQVPADVVDFAIYLSRHAPHRYLERGFYARGNELFRLDSTVWHLRRYCQNFIWRPSFRGKQQDFTERLFADVHAATYKANPHRFRLHGGWLEGVLTRSHSDPTRQALVWKNFFYGARRKHVVKNFRVMGRSANPPHFRHPELIDLLRGKAYFPNHVLEAMGKASSPKPGHT